MCFLAICMSSWRNVCVSLFPTFCWFLCFSSIELYELYNILEINPLSVVSFAIFSHSEGCLFTLLMVAFAVQKLLSLTRSHFLVLVFFFPLL